MSLWKRPYGPGNQNPTGTANTQGVQTFGSAAAAVPSLQTVTVNTEVQLVAGNNAALNLLAALESQTNLEQIPFDVNWSGYITTGTTTNVTLKVYASTAGALTTQLATSGAIAQNTASAPFFVRLKVVFDSVSGKLGGIFEGVINNTLFGPTALSNVVTGLANKTNPVITLAFSVTFSAANAGNLINTQDASIG